MYKNLSIRVKIGLGFLVIVALVAITSVFSYNSVLKIDEAEDKSGPAIQNLIQVANAEISHLEFIQHIEHYIIAGEAVDLDVNVDGVTCGLGKLLTQAIEEAKTRPADVDFYISDIPGVDIEELQATHVMIHTTVPMIEELVKAGDTELAMGILQNEVIPRFDELMTTLKIIYKESERVFIENYTILDTQENVAMDTILYGGIGAFILAMIIGYFTSKNITRPVISLVGFANEITKGNLNAKSDIDQSDEVGQLANALTAMVNNLKAQLLEVDKKAQEAEAQAYEAQIAKNESEEAAQKIETNHHEMMQVVVELEDVLVKVNEAFGMANSAVASSEEASSESAQKVYQTVTAMNEMNAAATEIARNSSTTTEIAKQSKAVAENGLTLVANVMESINILEEKSQALKDNMTQLSAHANSVGNIMTVISDIADQTNLLALNAAIEAARAGDAGRGFAVVADEVRKLAEKTMTSTVDVNKVITAIQESIEVNIQQVNDTVATVGVATDLSAKSEEGLKEIVSMTEASEGQVITIASASEEQAQTCDEINSALTAMNVHATATTDAIDDVKNSFTTLGEQAQVLSQLVERLQKF